MEIHCVQQWTGEVWRTVYLSSWPGDVSDTYNDLLGRTDATLRRVKFGVDSYDFVATHARAFAVLDMHHRHSDLHEDP